MDNTGGLTTAIPPRHPASLPHCATPPRRPASPSPLASPPRHRTAVSSSRRLPSARRAPRPICKSHIYVCV